jgi:hypothetical protein
MKPKTPNEREELILKVQAMVDDELPAEEIDEVLKQIEGDYDLREEYIALKKIKSELRFEAIPEPPAEWFEKLAKQKVRRTGGFLGRFFLIFSYLAFIGYVLLDFFQSTDAGLWPKIFAGTAILGMILLLAVTVYDRVQELKDDKYREVTK